MIGLPCSHVDYEADFVEVDPTGRYGRYDLLLGKGSSKTVYRAFDEYEGIEVAWNQVKLSHVLRGPEDMERLYCEIHLLKTLKHKNIMKFYTSWVDLPNRTINFVTEMFTSGTLKQYRQKHKRVSIRAVKNWCRQILKGLLYLHSLDPPVIHRDLKCDNIFINGNQGQVKIGDLGLAAILRNSCVAHCVGTPEFMAPEVYEEEYNELVDVYSFGMCVLEMVTSEYPYSECNNPAQIYKKVTSGRKPAALNKVKDTEVRGFIEKCLTTVSSRLSARELLEDPFLSVDNLKFDIDVESLSSRRRRSRYGYSSSTEILHNHSHQNHSLSSEGNSYTVNITPQNGLVCNSYETDSCVKAYTLEYRGGDEEQGNDFGMIVKGGGRRVNDLFFLSLKIADKEGQVRYINFPFDLEKDTAMSVASEMVAELDIRDQHASDIAEMIDDEICSFLPPWRRLLTGGDDTSGGHVQPPSYILDDYPVNDSPPTDSISDDGGGDDENVHIVRFSCPETHGRFEEITYRLNGSEDSTSIELEGHRGQVNCRESWGRDESGLFISICQGRGDCDTNTEQERKSGCGRSSSSGSLPPPPPSSPLPPPSCKARGNVDEKHSVGKHGKMLKRVFGFRRR